MSLYRDLSVRLFPVRNAIEAQVRFALVKEVGYLKCSVREQEWTCVQRKSRSPVALQLANCAVRLFRQTCSYIVQLLT